MAYTVRLASLTVYTLDIQRTLHLLRSQSFMPLQSLSGDESLDHSEKVEFSLTLVWSEAAAPAHWPRKSPT